MTERKPAAASPIRVLVADDHPAVRVGVATILEASGHVEVVGHADDGQQAVDLFRRLRPDVVLLDLQMPNRDGVEATRAIRGEFPDARVLMLTMYAGDEDIFRALQAGALGYVLKGATADEIRRAIEDVHAGRKHVGPEIGERLAERITGNALTPRELEVLAAMAEGLDNRAIAARLGIGVGTVKWYVVTILSKLDAPDRTNAVLVALRKGLVRLP